MRVESASGAEVRVVAAPRLLAERATKAVEIAGRSVLDEAAERTRTKLPDRLTEYAPAAIAARAYGAISEATTQAYRLGFERGQDGEGGE